MSRLRQSGCGMYSKVQYSTAFVYSYMYFWCTVFETESSTSHDCTTRHTACGVQEPGLNEQVVGGELHVPEGHHHLHRVHHRHHRVHHRHERHARAVHAGHAIHVHRRRAVHVHVHVTQYLKVMAMQMQPMRKFVCDYVQLTNLKKVDTIVNSRIKLVSDQICRIKNCKQIYFLHWKTHSLKLQILYTIIYIYNCLV